MSFFSAKWLILLYILPLLVFLVYLFSFLRTRKWFKALTPSRVLRLKLTKSRWILAKKILQGILVTASMVLLLFAGTSPTREVREMVPIKEPFKIVFGMDISLSSLVRDCTVIEGGEEVRILRLDMMKREMIKAVRLLDQDKVGLMLFTEKAVPILPALTTDYESAFIRRVEHVHEDYIRLLSGGTSLAAALTEGLLMFDKEGEDEKKVKKILILLTDAEEEETAPGVISPALAQAIQHYSQEKNISIWLVGVGDPTKASKIEKGINKEGKMEYYLKPNGTPVTSRPDPEKLARIAARTGGRYVHSQGGQELAQAFQKIITEERVISGYEERVVLQNLTGGIISVVIVLVLILLFL